MVWDLRGAKMWHPGRGRQSGVEFREEMQM